MSDAPRLSIVIPAFNEESRLGATLDRVLHWLDQWGGSGEILVVDDGSSDGTAALARARGEVEPRVQLLEYGSNRGKGYAVGLGVLEARGQNILFSDADLSTPIEEYTRLEAALESVDIAIGSRALPDSRLDKRQPLYREMMGRTFNLLVQGLVFPGIRDTQCGFKLFRADVAKAVFSRRKIDGFAFDVEILYIARKLGFRVAELPVIWVNDEESRVDPVRHSIQMFRDIVRIRRLHRQTEPPGSC